MQVFLTGATGYIGSHVAHILRENEHEVWGLTHDHYKVNLLTRRGIRAEFGEMKNPASYQSVAEKCDVLIHTARERENPAKAPELDKLTVNTLLDVSRDADGNKKLLYTSGIWIFGDTGGKVIDENIPLQPIADVSWREYVEHELSKQTEVPVVILRPGVVYGDGRGLTTIWFEQIQAGGPMIVVGDGQNHWAMVHVEDLAEGYRKAAETDIQGESFNLTDGSNLTVQEMAETVKEISGYKGEIQYMTKDKALEVLGSAAEGMALDQTSDPSKARDQLGWEPRYDFIASLAEHYQAWKNRQET